MGTNYIAPIWRMPRNANKDKLSNYSLEFGPTTIDVISTNTTWQTDTGLDNAKKVSFSVWVNPNSGTGSSKMNIVSQAYGTWDGNFNIAYTADTTTLSLDFRANNNAFINSSTLLAGDTWHHICFVIDLTLGGTIAQEVRCFVNNSEVVNQSSINPPLNFVLQLRSFNIGRRLRGPNAGSSNQWQGKIAQACFFNYALTDGTNGTTNQIEYLYNLNNPMAITGAKPVAYWPLGDNSNPNATAGYPNISVAADSVFNFDSNGPDYITTSGIDIGKTNTLSFWIKRTAVGNQVILNNNHNNQWYNYIVRLASSGDILYATNANGGSTTFNNASTRTLVNALNVWTNIVIVRTEQDAVCYVNNQNNDGVKTLTNNNWTTVIDNIGVAGDNASYPFNGELSNIQLWNTDLSSNEVETIYNNGQPLMTGAQPQTNNLKVWYKLNQSANWEADTVGDWQIPDNRSAYPQSFNFRRSGSGASTRSFVRIAYEPFSYPSGKVAASAWIQWNGQAGSQYIVADDYGSGDDRIWALWKTANSNKFRFQVFDQGGNSAYADSTTVLQTGRWYHVLGTYDGTSNADAIKIYVNGVYEANSSTTEGGLQTPTSISWKYKPQIGNGSNIQNELAPWGSSNIPGKISNVCIWTNNLTDGSVSVGTKATGEVAEVYNNGVPATSAVKSSDLIGWWKVDNSSKFIGLSYEMLNEVYQPTYNNAFNFGARDNFQFVEIPRAAVNVTNAICVSAWIKTQRNNTQQQAVISNYESTDVPNNGCWFFDIGEAWASGWTKMRFGVRPSSQASVFTVTQTSNQVVTDNTWHHVLALWDGTTTTDAVKIFVDGLLAGQGTASAAAPIKTATDSKPAIGKTAADSTGIYGNGLYFGGNAGRPGFISNVQVWDTALTHGSVSSIGDTAGGQVAELYNNGTPLTSAVESSNMKCWYKLDNLSTGANDSSGNGNNGTLGGISGNSISVTSTFVTQKAGNTLNTNNQGGSNMNEQSLVNNNVSVLNGESVGMNTTNLVTSDLTKKQPFSSYSIDFDALDYMTTTLDISDSSFTTSVWVKANSSGYASGGKYVPFNVQSNNTSGINRSINQLYNGSGGGGTGLRPAIQTYEFGTTNFQYWFANANNFIDGNWYNVVWTRDSSNSKIQCYVNGQLQTFTSFNGSQTTNALTDHATGGNPATPREYSNVTIGAFKNSSDAFSNNYLGQVSNCSIFNSVLSEDDILNIYNNEVTQDLSNFRITPTGWWSMDQSYTYFNGSVLVARDVINGNDGTGVNLIQENIVGNAPGSTGNGIGTNLTIADLKGNMSNSDKNAYSINMADYADGVTNPANSGRSTDIP
tara:strand:+ start:1779 stop:5759 length:3981 start_codon:yes stop_codon:yes gene_type:complete